MVRNSPWELESSQWKLQKIYHLQSTIFKVKEWSYIRCSTGPNRLSQIILGLFIAPRVHRLLRGRAAATVPSTHIHFPVPLHSRSLVHAPPNTQTFSPSPREERGSRRKNLISGVTWGRPVGFWMVLNCFVFMSSSRVNVGCDCWSKILGSWRNEYVFNLTIYTFLGYLSMSTYVGTAWCHETNKFVVWNKLVHNVWKHNAQHMAEPNFEIFFK